WTRSSREPPPHATRKKFEHITDRLRFEVALPHIETRKKELSSKQDKNGYYDPDLGSLFSYFDSQPVRRNHPAMAHVLDRLVADIRALQQQWKNMRELNEREKERSAEPFSSRGPLSQADATIHWATATHADSYSFSRSIDALRDAFVA